MKQQIKMILKNKIFQIFTGLVFVIIITLGGLVITINYLTHKAEIREEIIAFKNWKENQIEKDIKQIKQKVLEEKANQYSNFNHYIETPDTIIKSIEGGYCYEEDSFLFNCKEQCDKYGNNSVECYKSCKCRIEKYTPEIMYILIENHGILEGNEELINRAKKIYDKYPNWDIYSIILAAQDSINMGMLKEAALYIWDNTEIEKTEKVEDDFIAIWFWKKDCKNIFQFHCEGTDVKGYKRDLLVFNKPGTLFYFLIDR